MTSHGSGKSSTHSELVMKQYRSTLGHNLEIMDDIVSTWMNCCDEF
jgi:hypothetical protein